MVGGFTHEISADEYLRLAEAMDATREFALASVDLFRDFDTVDVQTEGDLLAMVAPDAYPVCTSDTLRFVRAGYDFRCPGRGRGDRGVPGGAFRRLPRPGAPHGAALS